MPTSKPAQVGAAGTDVNYPPWVLAKAADGTPVRGAVIVFQGTEPGAVAVTVTTGADGNARLPRWRLPAQAGRATLEARHGTLVPVTFETDVRVRAYNLTIRLIGGDPGPDGLAAIAAAKEKIESIIFGDLPDIVLDIQPACSFGGPPLPTLTDAVDDLLILLRVRNIDGLGGAGGFGTPCLIRDPGAQPVVSLIELDSAEWVPSSPTEKYNIVLHEFTHAVGFVASLMTRSLPSGFSRQCMELPSRAAPNRLVQDTYFSCPNARAAFDRMGGIAYTGQKVPLENGGLIAGTQGSLNNHWRETTFGVELMSAYYNPGVAPFSLATAAFLEDMGYEVSYAGADSFTLTPPISSLLLGSFGAGLRSYEGDRDIAPAMQVLTSHPTITPAVSGPSRASGPRSSACTKCGGPP
ncbi:MAG: hypothetical protein HOP28_02065 [Gemmatimonadales bacterium]|nr:hypothetical protein [Gemmatimonadales bacterium]